MLVSITSSEHMLPSGSAESVFLLMTYCRSICSKLGLHLPLDLPRYETSKKERRGRWDRDRNRDIR